MPKKLTHKSTERNVHLDTSNEAHWEDIEKFGRAISAIDRIRILNMLRMRSMSVVEVATQLNLPVSSTAHHLKVLEDARLILTEKQPGVRGKQRLGMCCVQQVNLHVTEKGYFPQQGIIEIDMPIGNYFDCDIIPTCGLADENGLIDNYDTPRTFFSQDRSKAQLLWFHQGYLEYRFPNHCTLDMQPSAIVFSLELCSEAPGYHEPWPSDITVSINDKKLGVYTSPSDFGARRGKLTPAYWTLGSTQYGLLKTFSIKQQGGFIDEQLVNDKISIEDLRLQESPYISFKIELLTDAHNQGGINIFGEKFGDFPQNIVMRIYYQNKNHA